MSFKGKLPSSTFLYILAIYYAVQVSNVESIDKMPHFVAGMNGYTDRRLAEVNK